MRVLYSEQIAVKKSIKYRNATNENAINETNKLKIYLFICFCVNEF